MQAAGLLKVAPLLHVHALAPSGVDAVPGGTCTEPPLVGGHDAPVAESGHCCAPSGRLICSPWISAPGHREEGLAECEQAAIGADALAVAAWAMGAAAKTPTLR